VGTTSYLPPEAIQALARKNATYVGPPADCWSLGVVVYVMLRLTRFVCYSLVLLILSSSGLHPFDYYRPYSECATPYECDNDGHCYTPRNSDDLVGRRIVQKTLCFEDPRWKKLPEGPFHVFDNHNPSLNFWKQAQDLVEGLLVRDPANRLGIKDALSHIWIRNSIRRLEKYNEILLVGWNKGQN
jgi:serine/threonine protein kinase